MHIGHDLPTVYTMEDGNKIIQLESTSVEKDLVVWVTTHQRFKAIRTVHTVREKSPGCVGNGKVTV